MSLETTSLAGSHVLLVDDDADFRAIVAATLAREGMTVRVAASAEEALAACETLLPSLIIMDVWMSPGRSGIQACSALRAAPATAAVPIILMSAQWHDERQLVRALDAGASDVLAKERAGTELMARVRSILARASVQVGRQRGELEGSGLPELLAICAGCKQVRNERGDWEDLSAWLSRTQGVELTHGICAPCRVRLYGPPPPFAAPVPVAERPAQS
jgi:DNA-binding response OmpR family regulator